MMQALLCPTKKRKDRFCACKKIAKAKCGDYIMNTFFKSGKYKNFCIYQVPATYVAMVVENRIKWEGRDETKVWHQTLYQDELSKLFHLYFTDGYLTYDDILTDELEGDWHKGINKVQQLAMHMLSDHMEFRKIATQHYKRYKKWRENINEHELELRKLLLSDEDDRWKNTQAYFAKHKRRIRKKYCSFIEHWEAS